MTFGAQQRVFRLIPGLERARFLGLGMIHRNTFICAPKHLDLQLRLRVMPSLRRAGQLTGVEGYVESAATGLLAGLSLAAELGGIERPPSRSTRSAPGAPRRRGRSPPPPSPGTRCCATERRGGGSVTGSPWSEARGSAIAWCEPA